MKCTSCGLPLSPARTMTSCPRCGTPIVSDKKSSSSVAQQPFPRTESWKPVASQTQLPEVVQSPMTRSGGRDESDPHRPDPFQPASAHVHSPVTFPPAAPTYMPQLNPMWLPTAASEENKGPHVQQSQVQEHGEASFWGVQPEEQLTFASQAPLHSELPYAASQRQSWQPGGAKADKSVGGARVLIDTPQAPLRPLRGAIAEASMIRPIRRGKNNLGFIAAGLCVIMGGLILVFVYLMAIGFPGSSTSNSILKTNTAATSSPIAASSPASSPTATPFPGQKYIDHAQLASKIDPTSHQATQLTTTFKASQNIYIIFQLHPAGQNGAVCLFWYANNKSFFSYQLPVYASERTSYSFASYGATGSGYVELYWASTVKCTDKILAQHVNFTVTG